MKLFMRKKALKRPEPTTDDIIWIFSEFVDEAGIRRARTGSLCPVCNNSMWENVLFPPPKYKDKDPVDMICCLSCGSRFRYRDIEKEGLFK